MDLNEAIKTLALDKMVTSAKVKEARAVISENEATEKQIEVNGYFHVMGSVRVGKDYEQTMPQKVDWKGLAMVALSKLNSGTWGKILSAYLSGELDVDGETKEAIQKEIDGLLSTTVTVCNGKVSAKVGYEEIGRNEVEMIA